MTELVCGDSYWYSALTVDSFGRAVVDSFKLGDCPRESIVSLGPARRTRFQEAQHGVLPLTRTCRLAAMMSLGIDWMARAMGAEWFEREGIVPKTMLMVSQ